MTQVLAVDAATPDPAVVAQAVQALVRLELLVYPTETLYALGGVLSAEVAARVRAAKGRDEGKPLPVIAAGEEQVRPLCSSWPETAQSLAARFWPGPLTLVLRARADLLPAITAGTGSVAVRVPGLKLARMLCEGAGALISTSANRSGTPPHAECAPAALAVGGHATLALDAGVLAGVASTILDLTAGPRLLRAGPIPLEELAGALHETGVSLQTDPERTSAP